MATSTSIWIGLLWAKLLPWKWHSWRCLHKLASWQGSPDGLQLYLCRIPSPAAFVTHTASLGLLHITCTQTGRHHHAPVHHSCVWESILFHTFDSSSEGGGLRYHPQTSSRNKNHQRTKPNPKPAFWPKGTPPRSSLLYSMYQLAEVISGQEASCQKQEQSQHVARQIGYLPPGILDQGHSSLPQLDPDTPLPPLITTSDCSHNTQLTPHAHCNTQLTNPTCSLLLLPMLSQGELGTVRFIRSNWRSSHRPSVGCAEVTGKWQPHVELGEWAIKDSTPRCSQFVSLQWPIFKVRVNVLSPHQSMIWALPVGPDQTLWAMEGRWKCHPGSVKMSSKMPEIGC